MSAAPKKLDYSPEAVSSRMRQLAEICRLCLSLKRAGRKHRAERISQPSLVDRKLGSGGGPIESIGANDDLLEHMLDSSNHER